MARQHSPFRRGSLNPEATLLQRGHRHVMWPSSRGQAPIVQSGVERAALSSDAEECAADARNQPNELVLLVEFELLLQAVVQVADGLEGVVERLEAGRDVIAHG